MYIENKKFLPCQPDNPTTQHPSQPANQPSQPANPTTSQPRQPASQPAMQRRQRGQHCVLSSETDVLKGNCPGSVPLGFGPPPRTIIFCNKSKEILFF